MIIEGAHKVMGKGIFVSDIQQGSLAFKVRQDITRIFLLTMKCFLM